MLKKVLKTNLLAAHSVVQQEKHQMVMHVHNVKCSLLSAANVAQKLKFLSDLLKENLFTVAIASRADVNF
jgi:hypothetical protein